MIYRIDVRTRTQQGGLDRAGEAVRREIAQLGAMLGPITTWRIFLIDTAASRAQLQAVADGLLADVIVEEAVLVEGALSDSGASRIEVHLKPGVMDPVASSTEMALRDMGIADAEVRTGRAFVIESEVDQSALERVATRILANPVIESVHFEAFVPSEFLHGHQYTLKLQHVSIRELTDEQLIKLSREGHLFLSLAEMKAIQNYYREQKREPTDIELETLAQTWSEHCVHKTLKSAVEVEVRDEAGKVTGSRRYKNLIKETIFDSTMTLMNNRITGDSPVGQQEVKHGRVAGDTEPFCLSVFADNAGVVAFDETDAVCFKVETHNHPSAIEPYGGAATGAGGVIRDILGTGLAARPVANTDVFCVAFPDYGLKPAPWATLAREIATRWTPTESDDPRIREWYRITREEQPADCSFVLVGDRNNPESLQVIHFFGDSDQGFVSYFDDGPNASELNRLQIDSLLRAGVPVLPDMEPRQRVLPKGVIHPRRVLQQVVGGVRDYGNRMGIPTVNGAVYFDDRYLGNPLVFCGCVGILPRNKIAKGAQAGDAVVVMGGRTGRDGIHGATFSSAELTDTHADEFSHAVQIGNAITEKKVADVILQARDLDLFTSVTDLGAGGLSSAIGEMGEKVGASVQLDQVPLKYQGLRYDEIWISEAQERMGLSVPQEKVAQLLELAKREDVEATVIGTFGTENAELILHYGETEVGRLSMHFMHKGIPMPTRKAAVTDRAMVGRMASPVVAKSNGDLRSPAKQLKINTPGDFKETLLRALAHPNVASKHWIIRQYDHEVQGGSVIKPLIGPEQIGPSDSSVIRPKLGTYKGVALGCGMAPHVADPYEMAIWAIDEAIRNVVCVGANLDTTAILDNFCWPSVDDEITMGTLVRACEACRDAALAYGVPFISGKDSLHNQFTNQETGKVLRIPNTLLISAMSVLADVRKCVTMDLKGRTHRVVLISAKNPAELANLAATARAMSAAIAAGGIVACHDLSDGGLAVAAAEMCIASGLGMIVSAETFASESAFDEGPGRYLVELGDGLTADHLAAVLGGAATITDIGIVQHFKKLTLTTEKERAIEIGLEELTAAWRGTLDW